MTRYTNDVTGKTCACFEPTLDYVVVKIPKWPFDKFVKASRMLGTQMKATGEVMAIGQSVEEAIMKAVRGAEINMQTLNCPLLDGEDTRSRLLCSGRPAPVCDIQSSQGGHISRGDKFDNENRRLLYKQA